MVGPEPSAEERGLLERFIDAHERCDAVAAVAIASQDIRVMMPLYPFLYDGLELLAPLLKRAFGEDRDGGWRLVPTMANRMPTAASYLRPGDSEFRALKLDVLRVKDGRISEITTFGAALSRRSACQRHFHDAARRAVSAALGDLQDCRAGEAPL